MKLVILTPFWKSIHGGGINTYTLEIANALKKYSKIEINVGYIDGEDDNNYKIPKGLFSLIFGTIEILKKIKPDVIQIHEQWPLFFSSVFYKIFNKKVKLIYYPLTESGEPNNILKKIIHLIKIFIYNWSFRHFDYIIIDCKTFQKIFEDSFKLRTEKKAVYLPMAITEKSVTKEEIDVFKNKFNIKEESIVLLIQAFTATETKCKGIILTLKVLKELIKKYPNIILMLTRQGEYSNYLKEYVINNDLEKNVIFTGDVDKPFIPLKICDLFLWPWLGESGYGLALLEAMSVGKPIIATSSSGRLLPLKNNDNALLVKPTKQDLFEGIIRLIQDREFANELGENARKTVIDNYTWEKVIKHFLKLYEE
jgi:glycosyltransferase involved in cell wall biosynthesis